MAWARAAFSTKEVDQAGVTYISKTATPQEKATARDIIFNWRASHGFPLNHFQMHARRRAATIEGAVSSQRLKRFAAIESKLIRLTPRLGLQLSEIQDIAGCRIIVDHVGQVRDLVKTYKVNPKKKSLIR